VSYPMDAGRPFSGDKARPGRDADHLPHLLPMSRMSTDLLLFSFRLHGGSGTSLLYDTI
jgi:hypothetical protein